MNVILDTVKRFLFEIICGVCALLAVGLGLVGMGRMSDVKTEVEQAVSVRGELKRMATASDPVNEEVVEQARLRIEEIRADFEEVKTFVQQWNKFEPLTDNVFPETRDQWAKQDFQNTYQQQMPRWLQTLNAGWVPTVEDVVRERDLMEAERPVDETLGAEKVEEGVGKPATPKQTYPIRPKETAEVRAAIRKAKSIYCYATLESFQRSYISAPTGPMYDQRPPSMEDMWHAQLEVWVQENVIKAIAELNNAAAERIKAQPADENEGGNVPWVGNLPIKELVSIQTTTNPYYILKEEIKPTGSSGSMAQEKGRAYPPGSAQTVFTGHVSNDLYEVVQFSVKLVIDARAIPEVIAGLCKERFNVPLNVAYEALPPNQTMEGKIFGAAPVVMMVIDFETVFFSEFYLPLMPDKILEMLKKKRPEPPKDTGTQA